jgi:hypothetical protein
MFSSSTVAVHASCIVLAWMLILPLSAIAVTIGSRWDKWFIAHVLLNTSAMILVINGTLYGFRLSSQHLVSSHGQMGVSVVILFAAQIILGIIISIFRKPTGSCGSNGNFGNSGSNGKIHGFQVLHWYLGRFLFLLAFATVFSGLLTIEDLGFAVYIVTGIVQLFFVSLYCFLLAME